MVRWASAAPSMDHEVESGLTSSVVGVKGKGDANALTEDEEKLFGDPGPTMRERDQMESDKAKQGLSGLRILTLSLALELGKVPSGGSVASIIYGSDARLSDMVKAARKAGLQTLTKVLEGGDAGKLALFMTGLIRDYSERGMVLEAQRLTTWWTETQSMCSSNFGLMVKYIRQYLDKFVGRGLPETVDMMLLMRIGGGGASDAGAADAMKMAKEAKARADQAIVRAETEAKALKAEVARLRARTGGDPGPSGPFKGRCHHCGQDGHRAADCPQKAAEKAEKARCPCFRVTPVIPLKHIRVC